MKKPFLKIVPGDWVSGARWLDFPQSVLARSPFDQSEFCRFRLAKEDVVKAAAARRRQPAFDLWSVVIGEPPRVPQSSFLDGTGLMSLQQAHACFRGIKRPCAEDDSGGQIIAYVMKPRFFFVYEPSMRCVAARQEVPDDLLFVCYVRLDEPCGRGLPMSKGVLTHWQFLESDEADESLPIEFSSRYEERLW